jgi:pyrroline-5-carboxylate reductase
MVSRLGIIGFGYMGESLVSGVRERHPETEIGVADTRPDRVSTAAAQYGAQDYTGSLEKLFSFADLVVIAVKPQDKEQICQQIGSAGRGARVLSVLAGTKSDFFADRLDTTEVCRFMPSLAAKVGKAVVGVSFYGEPQEQFRADCLEIAGALGSAQEVPEKLMGAVTGLSGSGLAFVFAFVHALSLGAARAGLPYDQAKVMALDVLDGAQAVLRETGEQPASMLSKVASPGGTTIEGINALEQGRFSGVVMDAVVAAAKRASELEG